jgi:hypothetical protein
MESLRAFTDLPDIRNGGFELRTHALRKRRKGHVRPVKQFTAEFVLKLLDAVA